MYPICILSYHAEALHEYVWYVYGTYCVVLIHTCTGWYLLPMVLPPPQCMHDTYSVRYTVHGIPMMIRIPYYSPSTLLVVCTTCGLSLVVLSITLLLLSSMESGMHDASTVRPVVLLSTPMMISLIATHCMDSTVRGHVMLHTCTSTSTRTATVLA
jgi:hypothetical protein